MKHWTLNFVALPLLLVLSSAATGQAACRNGAHNYDPNSETTIKGTVQEVQQQTRGRGWSGTHLLLRTDSETIDVHVGPASYIAQEQFFFAKGDVVEVIGSRITSAGTGCLIARDITKEGRTLTLRNAQGIPNWSGGRMR
jgi:hypothetical protein